MLSNPLGMTRNFRINKGIPRYLKLLSVFVAWFFSSFHNKLHNMKALVILSHHDHHFSYLLVLMNFCGSLWALLEYFREKKLPTAHRFNIGAHTGICAQISYNTLLYLPSLKSDSPILLLMLISLDWQFQEHSIAWSIFSKIIYV